MIQFTLEDGKSLQIERDAIEEKILLAVFSKFDQAREADKGLYTMLKQAVNMVMTFGKVDLKIPKGENSLEYLVAYYVSQGLDLLEKEPLHVQGKVMENPPPQSTPLESEGVSSLGKDS